ncbi:hypothetical protein E4U55_001073 [Claviceps digitariae]|nr:hypothetical protein E4U55_001073 [Claviceps digitariae]
MKFTTVLGSLVLSGLQVHASPLEVRDNGKTYCCIQLFTPDGLSKTAYVERGTGPIEARIDNTCTITVGTRSVKDCDGFGDFKVTPGQCPEFTVPGATAGRADYSVCVEIPPEAK